MSAITGTNKVSKHIQALVAAFVMTIVIAVAILALGLNALINKNVVQVKNSPAAIPAAVTTSSQTASQTTSVDPAQLQQLQNLITQYQSRETQYQNELKQAAQQLDQKNAQIQQDQTQIQQDQATLQQYQGLISARATGGVTHNTPDGRILIPQSRGFRGDD
jgi:chromosome segregation ATPase